MPVENDIIKAKGGILVGPSESALLTTVTKEHGEVEGEQTPNFSEGYIHTYIAKGKITIKKPINWPTGTLYAEIVIIEDAVGGREIVFEGISWISGEPVPKTTPNAINAYQIVSYNGGINWYGFGPQEGKEGAKGATGSEGFYNSKFLLPNAVPVYKEVGGGSTENKASIAESFARSQATNTLAITSGTPILAAISAPPKKVISAIGFYVSALEGTPANRTHLWVALLNSSFEVLRKGLDYTSSTNTPLVAARIRGLKLESTYESGAEGELLYALLCEVMSSTAAISIAVREGIQGIDSENAPFLSGLGNAGQTTPGALPSPVTVGGNNKVPYMVLL